LGTECSCGSKAGRLPIWRLTRKHRQKFLPIVIIIMAVVVLGIIAIVAATDKEQ
jgi:hypothetical protein